MTVPTSTFNRDTHAHLIARALKTLNVHAAVNKRHDIVVLPSASEEPDIPAARKCSGSAYKLTRLRSYHHGTMLLSADLTNVSSLLKSPAADIIAARGVASVPSPVANTGVEHDAFVEAAVREFLELYSEEAGVCAVHEEEAGGVEGVRKGMQELESMEWVYGQTPRFTIRLPGGVEVAVDKGVVENVEGVQVEGMVGARFGGEVVERCLVASGMRADEAGGWARSMVGGRVWGEV